MFVIVAVATDVRAVGSAAAVAIGATVALDALFGGPVPTSPGSATSTGACPTRRTRRSRKCVRRGTRSRAASRGSWPSSTGRPWGSGGDVRRPPNRASCVTILPWILPTQPGSICPAPSGRVASSSATARSAFGAGARSSRAIRTCRSSTWSRASRVDRPGRRMRSAPASPAIAGGVTPRPWTGWRSARGEGFDLTTRPSGPASSASTGRSPSAAASGGHGRTSRVSCGDLRAPRRHALP